MSGVEDSGPGAAPKRVLVAGATGYLGRFVAREFKRRGEMTLSRYFEELA